MTTYAGTGHRPDKLGGYTKEAFGRLVLVAAHWMKSLNDPDLKIISGMALGWDQALAMAAIYTNTPFIAAVPFEGQCSVWPKESKFKYTRILDRAAEIHVVSDGGYSSHKMQVRNEWMVDHSDAVVAMFNGTAGGTANCVAYAEGVHKPIINLYPEWLKQA
ncbi:MAG TPA: SLOG family protein [Candidatus Acidoferrales bacterium]|nr:SLOG family protein [Candidatus Acidoferrales bacterium]